MKPFSIAFTENTPDLLYKLKCSLLISTYKANAIVFLASNGKDLLQLPRNFDEPMGIALQDEKLAIANFNTIELFVNFPKLVDFNNGTKNNFDAVYYPRKKIYSNNLDIHDLGFGKNGEILGVSSAFSCIARLDTDFHFEAIWQPHFISNLTAEDKCHLNGMALVNGVPKYATAFSSGDTYQSWRANITGSGVLIDIEKNEILLDNLGMPHSPNLFVNEKGEQHIFYIESAKSSINFYNLQNEKNEVFYKGSGFYRGLCIHENYLFVACSKLRTESTTADKITMNEEENWAGILIFDLATKKQIAQIKYLNSVSEIYDIKVIANKLNPNLLTSERNTYKKGIASKGEAFFG